MTQNTIKQSVFQKMSQEWTALDHEYDNLFQNFLNHPDIKNPAEILKFKTLQDRLYSIEIELYKIADGTVIIQKK